MPKPLLNDFPDVIFSFRGESRRLKRATKLIAAMEARTPKVTDDDKRMIMEALVLLLKDRFGGAE